MLTNILGQLKKPNGAKEKKFSGSKMENFRENYKHPAGKFSFAETVFSGRTFLNNCIQHLKRGASDLIISVLTDLTLYIQVNRSNKLFFNSII